MKNYTSSVPASQSIHEIEKILIQAGARSVSKDYTSDGQISAISFTIFNPETQYPVMIRLPSDTEGAFIVLKGYYKRPNKLTKTQLDSLREQAKRTAWKIVLDWVAVQMSLCEMRQAEMIQVFLPYIWNGQTTLFQQMKASQTPCIGYKGDSALDSELEPDEEAGHAA